MDPSFTMFTAHSESVKSLPFPLVYMRLWHRERRLGISAVLATWRLRKDSMSGARGVAEVNQAQWTAHLNSTVANAFRQTLAEKPPDPVARIGR